ncbi:hypothetical protein R1flu_015672 [Riccia fluitans]|uniref:PIN-like protein n=1 Tax=Riccia fluitans TaxID=41844 RepID=A0ABD1YJN4_9MARC
MFWKIFECSVSPEFVIFRKVLGCRSQVSQSQPEKDKKELSFAQESGKAGRFFGLWLRRSRGKTPEAVLYNSKNVEAGNDEAEDHAHRHPLERGLLSYQQLANGAQGNLASELRTTDLSVAESADQITSNHIELSADGPGEERQFHGDAGKRYRKGNKQYPQNRGVFVESKTDRESEEDQSHMTEVKLQDYHRSTGPQDDNPREALEEAKVKEITGCILAIRRFKLACTRAISRMLRDLKGTLKDERKAVNGTIVPENADAEARASEGTTDENKKPSGSKRDEELDEIPWDVLKRLWENPAFVKFRVSISMANLTMALPTFLSRALPLLSSTSLKGFSFPVLAPLLFGGGIVFKSAVSNLGIVLPRMLMSMAIMWVLWALNHVIQEAIQHLKDNGSFDRRVASVFVLFFELTFSAIAVVTVLSSIGLNVNNLLLPSFLALALAGKDVWQNYFTGFFLFAAQPFRPGHTVAIMCGQDTGGPQGSDLRLMKSGWFEGVCEAVDLRYTVLRSGRHRLMVPNAIFVKREFMIIDTEPQECEPAKKQYRRRHQQQQTRAQSKQLDNVDIETEVSYPPLSYPSLSSHPPPNVSLGDSSVNEALSRTPSVELYTDKYDLGA